MTDDIMGDWACVVVHWVWSIDMSSVVSIHHVCVDRVCLINNQVRRERHEGTTQWQEGVL